MLVFVDSGGSFNNDTECVNGPRGNVADHLTKDVVPYVNAHFGTSASSADWGIVGWSMGGTCAVDLTVMHPELFSSFLDIAGDTGPNAGTKDQTVARLYGGNAAAWAQFDPSTVIAKHGPYKGVSGWFAISTDAPTQHHDRAQQRRRRRARRPRRAGHADRPDARPRTRCAASARPGHHLLGGADDGPPRLAAGHPGVHRGAAVAGGARAHARRPPCRCPRPSARQARAPRRSAGTAAADQSSSARSTARVRARPSGDASNVAATYSSTPAARSSASRSLTVASSPMMAASSGPA